MVLYYSNNPEVHIEWAAQVSRKIKDAPFSQGAWDAEHLLVNLILTSASAPALNRLQREKIVWSVLLSMAVDEKELASLRTDPKPLLRILRKGVMSSPEIILPQIADWLPDEVWRHAWRIAKDATCLLDFETSWVLFLLASRSDDDSLKPMDRDYFQEHFEQWYSTGKECYDRQADLIISSSAQAFDFDLSSRLVTPDQSEADEIVKARLLERNYIYFLFSSAALIPEASDKAAVLFESFRRQYPVSVLTDKQIMELIEDGLSDEFPPMPDPGLK